MMTNTRSRHYPIAAAALLLTMVTTPAPGGDLTLQSGFVEHDGERIYFESVGAGDTVVLSHGAGGTHAVWYQQVVVLAQKYRVVTWDQREFGRSTDGEQARRPRIRG